jgi:type III restriction enzyme
MSGPKAESKPIVIENPVINSPFREPERHFRFDENGITGTIDGGRRRSSYFVPIPATKKKGKQLAFDTEWTRERVEENKTINEIRTRVDAWRRGGWVGVTPTTRELLEYWTRPDRERPLFFCQIEAAETAIYIAEVAGRYGDGWIHDHLREQSEIANPGLPRMAFKMATGSGKTVVMAMLIAWQTLNKLRNPQDPRFSDAFLVVAPGITIRDRLRVLFPNDSENFFRQRDVVSPDRMADLERAKIVIVNFHAFLLRERGDVSRITKSILEGRGGSVFTETPAEMVRRVCRDLSGKRNVVVLNDEAHHCYRRKADSNKERLTADERREARKRDEDARVWISGLKAIERRLGLRQVFDLSATPFFLKGSGHPEGTLFPWVVSDFSLIDAIECGIVKVPRVPVADNSMTGDVPTYRDLWLRIRDDLPKKGRKAVGVAAEPKLPAELQGALHSLYDHYRKAFENTKNGPPPVFIVVCQNTQISKLVFDWIAGWEKPLSGGTTAIVPGNLALFRNESGSDWLHRPVTVLVDSEQLESGEAMSQEFKAAAKTEIEEFKQEYRKRFPGRDVEDLTDEDLLREVMNTIGKPGKLGEQIRCVVSVSMLTEGWDANTVTHILGVRAFGTQLLCEQVVGRGLRRRSYAAEKRSVVVGGGAIDVETYSTEYADIYGIPFSFIPCAGSTKDPVAPKIPTRVRALEERAEKELTFPRVVGYRWEIGDRPLRAEFTDDSRLALSTKQVPTMTQNSPIVGESVIHTLDDLRRRRPQEVEFLLAKLVLERYFRQDGETRDRGEDAHRFDAEVQAWRFPEILRITREWLARCVTLLDEAFPQMLLLIENAHDAADRIYRAIVKGDASEATLRPILRNYEPVGTTRWVDFDTTKPVYPTDPEKSHVSHVVADTESWEQKVAQSLEEMDEVKAYVKNQGLGFTIPYTIDAEIRQYFPDFLVRLRHSRTGVELNLVLEVSGEKNKDKEAKTSTARTLWVPAVNGHGGFGLWSFVEVTDPWETQRVVRGALRAAVNAPEKPEIDMRAVEAWCRKWNVVELATFGSFDREDFRAESDVDFLVRFAPEAKIGWEVSRAEEELAEIVGRDVDLVSKDGVERSENWLRRQEILESARVIYAVS